MDGNEKLIFFEDRIIIDSCRVTNNNHSISSYVMATAESGLMRKFAEIGTTNGGHILEIGFGMHLSADAVQSNPNVVSHTIIEVHPEQYKIATEWAKNQKKETKIILGNWIDILPIIGIKFDGILHDTHLDKNIPKFLDFVKDNCKKNTVVVFFHYPKYDEHSMV